MASTARPTVNHRQCRPARLRASQTCCQWQPLHSRHFAYPADLLRTGHLQCRRRLALRCRGNHRSGIRPSMMNGSPAPPPHSHPRRLGASFGHERRRSSTRTRSKPCATSVRSSATTGRTLSSASESGIARSAGGSQKRRLAHNATTRLHKALASLRVSGLYLDPIPAPRPNTKQTFPHRLNLSLQRLR